MPEVFQPIAVRPRSHNRFLFWMRCVLDLQLLTIFRFLRTELKSWKGPVLDVGAGKAPWRELMSEVQYTAVDVESANEFGMGHKPEIIYYDGTLLPFPDASFNHVLCTEVLEHVADPIPFLDEIARVLRPGGSLALTVPWSARLNYVPHDFTRFSRWRLAILLETAGFSQVRIEDRGNDIAVVANKLLVLAIRLMRPLRTIRVLWNWPLALLVATIAAGFLLAAHLSMLRQSGFGVDPLGYAVSASK